MNYKYIDESGKIVLLQGDGRFHIVPDGFSREDAIEITDEEYRQAVAEMEANNPPSPPSVIDLEARIIQLEALLKQK